MGVILTNTAIQSKSSVGALSETSMYRVAELSAGVSVLTS